MLYALCTPRPLVPHARADGWWARWRSVLGGASASAPVGAFYSYMLILLISYLLYVFIFILIYAFACHIIASLASRRAVLLLAAGVAVLRPALLAAGVILGCRNFRSMVREEEGEGVRVAGSNCRRSPAEFEFRAPADLRSPATEIQRPQCYCTKRHKSTPAIKFKQSKRPHIILSNSHPLASLRLEKKVHHYRASPQHRRVCRASRRRAA